MRSLPKPTRSLVATVLLGTAAAAAAGAHRHGGTLFATAPANADGGPQIVVADIETGLFRAAFPGPGGSFDWTGELPSGAPGLTDLALGDLDGPGAGGNAILFASPTANRLQVVRLAGVDDFAAPEADHFAGPGPGGVALYDVVPGDPLDVAAASNFSITGDATLSARKGDTPTAFASDTLPLADLRALTPAPLTPGGAERLVAWAASGPGAEQLAAIDGSGAGFVGIDTAGPFPAGSEFATGEFEPGAVDFVVYQPDSGDATVLRGAAGGFGPPATHPLPFKPALLLPLDTGPPLILAISTDGQVATLSYTAAGGFSVEGAPDLSALNDPPTGAVPLPSGEFLLLSGAAGSSSHAHRYKYNGSGHSPVGTDLLPDGLESRPAPAGNVFFWAGTPFQDENPKLLGQLSYRDWTRDPIPGALARVTGETFTGSTFGLGGAQTRTLGPAYPGTAALSTNQHTPAISIVSLSTDAAVLGGLPLDCSIAPASGTYGAAVAVTLASGTPGATLYFRTGAGRFIKYSSPRWIFTDTEFEAYAVLPTGETSRLVTATYTFDRSPEEMDADGDTLPDFVELAEAVDPTLGSDSDGDGHSDLAEALEGSALDDGGDFPAGREESLAKIDLAVTPRPWVDGAPGAAAVGTEIRAYDVSGILLGQGTAAATPGLPAAAFTALPVDHEDRLLVLGTATHFDVQGGGDPHRGRELAKLIPAPEPYDPTPAAFTYDHGQGAAANAAAWLDARAAAEAAAPAPSLDTEISIYDTLTLLLVEARLGWSLSNRFVIESVEKLSLTPYRPGEAGSFMLTSIGPGDLLDLESPVDFGFGPPFASDELRSKELLATVEAAVANDGASPDPDMAALRALTEGIYVISGSMNNVNPDTFPPPITVLRDFICFGFLQADYAALLGLDPAEVDAARNAVFAITALPPRPSILLNLELLPPGADGELLGLDAVGDTFELRAADGSPYELPEALELAPGAGLIVSAFDDLDPAADPHPVEVYAVSLLTLAAPSPGDADGNLLPDDFELFFFGASGQDNESSPDGSGYTLLHQYLAGTDPTDPADTPAEPPLKFAFVDPEIDESLPGDGLLRWGWPKEYADAFEFFISATDDLGGFTEVPAQVTHLGGGQWQAGVDTSGPRRFFTVGVRLR